MDEKNQPSVDIRPVSASESQHVAVHTVSADPEPGSETRNLDSWPSFPQSLEERQRDWKTIAYDTVLLLLPIGLIAKAVLVVGVGYNVQGGDQSVDTVTPVIPVMVNLNDQLVTLFTVIFATIIATLVRRYALWKAQRGSSVAELEQLHSSVSLPKTLALIWSLRSWTLTSVGLVVIWSWYYLGSQAVSRELRLYDSAPLQDIKVATPKTSQLSVFELGTPSVADLAVMDGRFLQAASVGFSNQTRTFTGYDIFGDAMIPNRHSYYHNSNIDPDKLDKEGWWQITYPSLLSWTSFTGLPLHMLFLAKGDTVECFNDCWLVTSKMIGHGQLSTTYVQPNCSFPTIQSSALFPAGVSAQVNAVLNMTNDSIPTIQIAERHKDNQAIIAYCTLTETKVDYDMSCSAVGCKALRIRTTPNQPLTSTLFGNWTAANSFLESMQSTLGVPSGANSSHLALLDRFSQVGTSPASGFVRSSFFWYSAGYAHAWKELEADQPGALLIQLLNAYLSVSQQVLQDTDTDHLVSVLQGTTSDPTYTVSTLQGARYFPQYRIDWVWMVIDFVACVVLLAAASAAVWLRRQTLAPDIFGYVSSLTRDNPMIPLPAGGSTLDGIDRARMLKGVKIRIVDIGGEHGSIGRVGIVMQTDTAEHFTDLQKGRKYA